MARAIAYVVLMLISEFPLMNSLFSQTPISFSTCDLIVDAGPDTNVCFPGGTIGLMGSITGGDIFFQWTPTTGLSNPLILTPIANITGPITYTLHAWAIDPNSNELICLLYT